MKIFIWGIGGRLGSNLRQVIAESENVTCAGGFDAFASPENFDVPVFSDASAITVKPDVIIDFSRAEAVRDLIPYAVENHIPVVIASTGHEREELDLIEKAAKNIAVFKASNMSIGINLLINLAEKAAAFLGTKFDVEIIEQHHNVKADAPSGTALSIAEAIRDASEDPKEFVFGRQNKNKRRAKSELGIHAVRGGTVVGKHDVLFLGNDEVITISHEAQSKTVFSEGALKAASFIVGKPAGLYSMKDMLK